MNKKGKTSGLNVFLVIAVVALAYLVLFPASSPFAPAPAAPAPSVDTTICPVDKTAFQPKMTKLGEASTVAATNYFIITDRIGNQSSAAAVDVPTNYKMKVLFGYGSAGYYKIVRDIDSGCTGLVNPAIDLAHAQAPTTLYLKNANGQVNSVSTPQPIGADDTFEGTIYLKTGTNRYFGNPTSDCQNVGVVEYNKTSIKSVEGLNSAPIPRAFSYTNVSYDGSAAFYIPKAGNNKEESFALTIKSTSVDPGTSDVPRLHIYDCDDALHTRDLSIIKGVEDNNGDSLSLVSTSMYLFIS